VVKTHAFGDSLLATPAVAALVAAGNSVTILSGPSSQPVWSRMPGVEKVIQTPAPCSTLKLFLWSLLNLQKGYDKVIHLGSSPKAYRWLTFLTRGRVISGGDGVTGFGLKRPASLEYCRLAGVQCAFLKPVFPVTLSEIEKAKQLGGKRSYVVLAPGGARNVRDYVPLKRWPMERWAQVSLFLKAKGHSVFLVGGKEDTREISSVTGINMAGKLSWGETAALINGATLFAGNDSGPAHLAVAGDVPALVLFGPTDPGSLYSEGSIVHVTGTVACAPCYANSIFPGCKGNGDCMTSIGTDRVLNTLEGMLQK